APVPQAVERLVERGQVEGLPADAHQAIVSQAEGKSAVLAVHDPRVPGEAQIEQGGAYHLQEGDAPGEGGSKAGRGGLVRNRLLNELCGHAALLPHGSVLNPRLVASPWRARAARPPGAR